MGTSADFGGPRGGDWTAYKRAASNYARFGEEKQRKKLLHAFARARGTGDGGGAAGAGGGGGGGTGGGGGAVGGLGGAIVGSGPGVISFASDVASGGLSEALDKIGRPDLIGKRRYEVVEALVDELSGDGAMHDNEHGRNALVAAMPLLLPDDADDYEALANAPFDEARAVEFFEFWATDVVMGELALVLDKHLQKCDTVAEQVQRESDLRADISSYIRLETDDRETASIDWFGPEGVEIMSNVRDNVEAMMLAEGDE